MNHTPEARKYNEEVAYLIAQRLACPLCNAAPVSFEPIQAGKGSLGTCRNDHVYFVDGEEDDE